MRFSVLSSGSKANCTFIECAGTRILIDCGLSARRTEQRLVALGINPETISAIIVTHEHSDHICGIGVMSRKHKLPVYLNPATQRFVKDPFAVENFRTGEPFQIDEVRIHPFSIVHDAVDPVGFVIEGDGTKFVQLTDLGRVTPLVRDAIKDADAIVLESNHDQEMLKECDYPWELKQRIASTHGHLSNNDAATLLAQVVHDRLRHVVLGHLSENSNTPERALKTAARYLELEQFDSFICASIEQQTPLFGVGREASTKIFSVASY